MDHGTIIEDGNHKTLMEKKGAYYQLYMNQFKDLSIQEQVDTYSSQIEAKGVKISQRRIFFGISLLALFRAAPRFRDIRRRPRSINTKKSLSLCADRV
jgi:hypothetical protein